MPVRDAGLVDYGVRTRVRPWLCGVSFLPHSSPIAPVKLLTLARDLQRRKARERQHRFVAEGVRTVEALLASVGLSAEPGQAGPREALKRGMLELAAGGEQHRVAPAPSCG